MRAPLALLCSLMACGAGTRPPAAGGDGDSCAKPLSLSPSSDPKGTTVGLADDDGSFQSSCGGDGAPDVVYGFSASKGAVVDVKVTPQDSSFQPIVKLRGATHGCESLDDRCQAASAPGQKAEVTGFQVVTSGTQYVVVDGVGQSAGAFEVALTLR